MRSAVRHNHPRPACNRACSRIVSRKCFREGDEDNGKPGTVPTLLQAGCQPSGGCQPPPEAAMTRAPFNVRIQDILIALMFGALVILAHTALERFLLVCLASLQLI